MSRPPLWAAHILGRLGVGARGGDRTHQPADYKSAALPLRHSGPDGASPTLKGRPEGRSTCQYTWTGNPASRVSTPPFLRAWAGRQPAVAERASSVYGCTEVPIAGAGGALRPSVVFLGLFLVLMLVYRGLADVVGSGATFGIQAALVVALVAGLTWYRRKGAALDPPGRAPAAGSPKESGPNEVSDSAERRVLRTGQACRTET